MAIDVGTLEYFGAHHRWLAQFKPGWPSPLWDVYAVGQGPSPDHAILACLQCAEVDFDWHGSARFDVVDPLESSQDGGKA